MDGWSCPGIVVPVRAALIWGLPFVQFVGVLLAAVAAFSVLALRPPTMVTVAIVIGLEFAAANVDLRDF